MSVRTWSCRFIRMTSASSWEFSPDNRKHGQTYLKFEDKNKKVIGNKSSAVLMIQRRLGPGGCAACRTDLARVDWWAYFCNSLQPMVSLLILRRPLISKISKTLTIVLGSCREKAREPEQQSQWYLMGIKRENVKLNITGGRTIYVCWGIFNGSALVLYNFTSLYNISRLVIKWRL